MYKDLKASHIFIDKNLRVTLIDFGMCEKTNEEGKTENPAGTFHAMSSQMLNLFWKKLNSETIESLDHVGIEHDYYTLGVLLFELLFP